MSPSSTLYMPLWMHTIDIGGDFSASLFVQSNLTGKTLKDIGPVSSLSMMPAILHVSFSSLFELHLVVSVGRFFRNQSNLRLQWSPGLRSLQINCAPVGKDSTAAINERIHKGVNHMPNRTFRITPRSITRGRRRTGSRLRKEWRHGFAKLFEKIVMNLRLDDS